MGKILIVEDFEEMRDLLPSAMVVYGFKRGDIITAADGGEALDKLECESIDVMALDMAIPKMNGTSVLKMMEQKDLFKRTRVVVFSAHSEMHEFVEEMAKRLGIEIPFLDRPVDPKLLADTIKRLRQI